MKIFYAKIRLILIGLLFANAALAEVLPVKTVPESNPDVSC
jgi:hypothetical protein